MKKLLVLLALLALPRAAEADYRGIYTRHVQLPAGSSTLGPTAPTPTTYATAIRCLAFDNNSEQAFITMEIPGDWVADTDMTIEVDWIPSDADLGDGETVIWKWDYISVAENEDADTPTATTLTATHTAATPSTTLQGVMIHSPTTISYNDANNPIVDQDHFYFRLYRDMTADTFTGDACVTAYEILYQSDGPPEAQ